MSPVANPSSDIGNRFPEPCVVESSAAAFSRDVVEASLRGLIFVDFWAPWCAPCRAMRPVLENAITRRAGTARLVTINVDDNQSLASQYLVRSLPMVVAFQGGQPVDALSGAHPESDVAAFVDRLFAPEADGAEAMLARAAALVESGEAGGAIVLFERVLARSPDDLRALAGVFRCRVARGEADAVRRAVAALPVDVAAAPELASVRAILDIIGDAGSAEGLRRALGRLSLNPEDHAARLDAARAFLAKGDVASATDHLFDSLKRDPTWNESAARRHLMKIWDVLGPRHPTTIDGRRRLSCVLAP